MYRPLLAFLAALVAIPVLGGDGSAVTTPIQQTSGSTSGFTLEWEQRGFAAARRMPFFAGDINRDGLDEIVSAASTWWSVVSVSGGKPALIYQSPIFNRTITSLAVGQADTDPALEIVIAFDREVRIHDGVTFALQRTLTVPETEIRRMTVGDLQADGSPEIAYCGYYGGRVLNIATGTTLLSRECWDAAIGNVDSDPAAELVLAGGTDFPNGRRGASMVIDGVTQAIEWAPSVSFGNYIALVDDDGDGRSRIVGAQGSGKMHLFDALSRAVVASHTPAYEVDALRVVDAEGTVSSRSSTETTSGEPSWCSNPLLSRFGGGGPIPAGASAISQPPTRIETAKESSSGLLKTSGCSSTSSAGLPMRSRPVFPPTQTLPGRWISTTSTRTASPICWGQAQGPGSSQTPEIAGSPGVFNTVSTSRAWPRWTGIPNSRSSVRGLTPTMATSSVSTV